MKKPKPPPQEGVGQLAVKYTFHCYSSRIDGNLTWSNVFLKVYPDNYSLCMFNSSKENKIQLQTVTKLQRMDKHAFEIIDSLNPRIFQFTKATDCENWFNYLEEYYYL